MSNVGIITRIGMDRIAEYCALISITHSNNHWLMLRINDVQ